MSAWIEISADEIARAEKVLAGVPGGAEKAVRSAMDRALSRARTQFKRDVHGGYYAKQKDIAGETRETLHKASGALMGEIEYAGTKIPLYKFSISQRYPGMAAAIRAAVKKGGGGTFKHAFIAQMKSGHLGMFERAGNGRLPIREVTGLAMAQMAANGEIEESVEEMVHQVMDQRLEHEIWRILNEYGG